ncbi:MULTISPECIES: hypothetical protein [Aerococcus]|uniref:Uncharacterized protein n=1 Tax=Aerococcus sanguinicola TaxID=119206 RepID=A0A5N1GKN0_9LACT|nr:MULTISPECIES: hypothetical protein [Aerococcus]KAA9300769.1 hypothetical protein F6I03_05540 [Aerococcus sanguinicola]MDK6369446.1 hypothetical protein [Aerococcus sp. UMB9870]MDK6680509.1 hypothetical protein [Aerococcus sp. UMB8608]MDK6686691.1 hypothetical protein [Aerococcus sp. UMB8623]MDK6940456.1 hypothetical protein [Aerococcus sp. UMB8487]
MFTLVAPNGSSAPFNSVPSWRFLNGASASVNSSPCVRPANGFSASVNSGCLVSLPANGASSLLKGAFSSAGISTFSSFLVSSLGVSSFLVSSLGVSSVWNSSKRVPIPPGPNGFSNLFNSAAWATLALAAKKAPAAAVVATDVNKTFYKSFIDNSSLTLVKNS